MKHGKLSRRQIVTGATAAALLNTSAVRAVSKKSGHPNILFILADDLGYADLSCYGRRDYRTPHIDRIAATGMRFLQAYANSAVCSATRTALMTGRYQYRLPVGLEEPIGLRNAGLPADFPTLPAQLRKAGYATCLIGKWHLGSLPDFDPLKSGYDSFWGIRGGGVDYFTHAGPGGHDLWDGPVEVHRSGYMTDLIGQQAVQTLGSFARGEKPFFMSLHFTAPHWPWEGPDDAGESNSLAGKTNPLRYFHFDGGSQKIYASMVTRMDMQVGRVLSALKSLGLDQNTIVIFTSDNGGERFSDVWPFTGRKSELLEGGIRIPCLVRWPGRVGEGTASDAQIMTMDWLPTLLAAAGAGPDKNFAPDGLNIMLALQGEKLPPRPIFWRYKNLAQEACRENDWKYLKIAGNSFLFNLAEDPLERANLKERHRDIYARLTESYRAWNATMLPIDPETISHGFSGTDLADHYGSTSATSNPGK
jgi:arylsulfatase A-like enzyme